METFKSSYEEESSIVFVSSSPIPILMPGVPIPGCLLAVSYAILPQGGGRYVEARGVLDIRSARNGDSKCLEEASLVVSEVLLLFLLDVWYLVFRRSQLRKKE
jgi:hypothetical protein